jgi:hypothetical protein
MIKFILIVITVLLVLAKSEQYDIEFHNENQVHTDMANVLKNILGDPEYVGLDLEKKLKVLNILYDIINDYYNNHAFDQKRMGFK